MSTPIKREDIRKGDKIRKVVEFISGENRATATVTLELIERPVVLPTKPGVYSDIEGDTWKIGTYAGARLVCIGSDAFEPERYAPFTLLRPVAEVAAEVLAEVSASVPNVTAFQGEISKIAEKWATN